MPTDQPHSHTAEQSHSHTAEQSHRQRAEHSHSQRAEQSHSQRAECKETRTVNRETGAAAESASEADSDAMVRALVGERLAPLEPAPSKDSDTVPAVATATPKREKQQAVQQARKRRRSSGFQIARKYAESSPEELSEASDSEERRLVRKPSFELRLVDSEDHEGVQRRRRRRDAH